MTHNALLLTCCLHFLAVLLCTTGCGHKAVAIDDDQADDAAVVQVIAAHPQRKALTLSTTQPGKIEAFEQTPLFAKVAGYVGEVLVDIGDTVARGQLLIRLSVPELIDDVKQRKALVAQAAAEVKQAESNVLAAEAAAETAHAKIAEAEAGISRADAEQARWQSEYERIKELAAGGSVTKKLEEETLSQLKSAEASIQEVTAKLLSARAAHYESRANVDRSKADFVAAQARLQVAQTELARAETMLGYTEITAPYDATVTRRLVDTGHFVNPGDQSKPLFVVARTDIVRVFFDVPELEAPLVDPGDPATVRVQATVTKEFSAEVTRTSWTLQDANRSLRAEVDLANPEGILRPGMYATVTIRLDERNEVLTLPIAAIMRDGDAAFCWLVESGTIVRRPLQLGIRSGGEVEVVSGVSADDLVIVKQPDRLNLGQRVSIASEG